MSAYLANQISSILRKKESEITAVQKRLVIPKLGVPGLNEKLLPFAKSFEYCK